MILSSYDLEKINSLPWNIVLWWETKIKSKEKHYSLNFYWSSALPLHPHKEPCRQIGNGVCDYPVTAPLCSSLFLRLSFWSGVGSPWALSSSRTYPPALAQRPQQAAVCSVPVHVLQMQKPASTWSCQKAAKRLSALVPGIPPHLFLIFLKIIIIFLDEHICSTNTGVSFMGKKIAAYWL